MPAAETVRKVLDAIKTKAEADYFFDSITSPDWIGPLAAVGFFKSPPDPVVDEEGVRFPVWHESRYLARVAQRAPDKVLEVLLGVPDTRNVRVHEDLLDAALAMPAALAVSLTDKAIQWAESPYQLLLPLKLAALALHFARGGENDSALRIIRALLTIPPQPGEDDESGEAVGVGPTARTGDFEYQRILRETVPQLVTLIGMPVFDLLCELLTDIVQRFHGRGGGEVLPADDQSRIWHPDLEDGSPYEYGGNESHLVSAVLNTAIRLVEQNPAEVQQLVATLRSHKWGIFHRLALELLRRFPAASAELVHERLLDRVGFDLPVVRREYGRLLQEQFASLDEGARLAILAWIDDGPQIDGFRRSRESWTGSAPSEEETAAFVRQWQLDWLGLVAPELPPDWRHRHDELAGEFGPATNAHVAAPRIRMWSGSASPKGADELAAMDIVEIVRFLREWEPDGGFGAPSREGLAQALAEAVATEPSRFAAEAMAFGGKAGELYVQFLLDGFWRAAKDYQRPFRWEEVLALCKDFLGQRPKDSLHQSVSGEGEGRLRIVAQLLQAGLREGATQIPIERRSAVWDLLSMLTTHPDPTPETEATYGGANMDPVTLSLNHVRGAAMNAVIDYAIWVWRHAEEDNRGAGFDLMPEVPEVLEWHLDPRNDPSLAIRSVYGRMFPVLNALDARWASENLRRIFPTDQNERSLWESAWGAFLLYSQLSLGLVVPLRDIYRDAVDSLAEAPLVPWHGSSIDLRLAEHLMTYFWHGRLALEETGGLLPGFYANASLTVRARAIDFIGRSLQSGDAVAKEFLNRLTRLWDSRLAAVRQSTNPGEQGKELAGFGWWFSSGRFDDEWALNQLLEVLRLGVNIDPDWHVAERLVTLADRHGQASVECMRLVVEAAERRWGIRLILESVKALIRIVTSGSDPQARSEADRLANWLGARGYRDLRDAAEETR